MLCYLHYCMFALSLNLHQVFTKFPRACRVRPKKRKKMKWGRKKTSLFARVFSGSWFSKLMPKAGSFETDSLKNKHKSEMGYPTRFYSLDEDDAYWRMSFAEEQIQQGRRSTGGINPLWHDHHPPPDHGFHDSVLGTKEKELLSRRDQCLKFNDMVSDVRMRKERQDKKKILGDKYEDFSDPCSRMPSPGVCFNKQLEISSEDEEGGFPGSASSWKYSVSTPIKKPNHITRFGLSPVEENHVLEPPAEDAFGRISFSEWQDMEDKRIKVRTDCQKKSAETKLYNKVRVKAYSPNTECKGGAAIDTMKKSRMKWKKGRDDTASMEYSDTIFDSFAVVKTSSDPHRDFRDSMVDMIQEEGITRHEELEDLLSCYLTLNSDEYHDLIIKVFQDVWLEMNGGCVSVHPMDNGKMFR